MTIGNLDRQNRINLAHLPTPLEFLPNLTEHIGKAELFIKRDDCTGLALGGNKARQLEYYFGAAQNAGADTVLITGAVQSNFARMTAAAARKLGMDCHIQVEERVPNSSALYHHSGNVLLSRMLGAKLHSYPQGEDEEGADNQLEEIAARLSGQGKKPYVIHLGLNHSPIGALGYVSAAKELVSQIGDSQMRFDEIIVASGSGATHAGLLYGLCALGTDVAVKGICVRRSRSLQIPRISLLCEKIGQLLDITNPVLASDIDLNDDDLAPGYGTMNDQVGAAMKLLAHQEGIILDPVYTGRAMAGFLKRAQQSQKGDKLLFIHTGGQPAVFGYEDKLLKILSDNI